MKHADLFFDTPKEEPTEVSLAAAKELDIPAEAMEYIMEVWSKTAYRVLFDRHSKKS